MILLCQRIDQLSNVFTVRVIVVSPKSPGRTKVPVRTVRYNAVKIRHQGNVKHRDGNGRPRKTPANINLSIGQ